MTIRHKTFLLASALSALAAGAIAGAALAADLKLRPQVRSADTSDYDQTLPAVKPAILAAKKTTPNTRDVTGTIESQARARSRLTPVDTSDYDQTPPAAKLAIATEKKTGAGARDVTGTIESPARARARLTPVDTSDYDQTPPAAKLAIATEKKTGAGARDVTGTIETPASARSRLAPVDTSDYDQMPPAAKSAIATEKKTGAGARDVTGTIEWPASARASLTPATAAISHTYSARASFAKARSAMESGILLREDVPKPNFASLEAATGDVLSELKALDVVTQHRSDEAIKRAMTLVQDWYETGLKIIKPPPQGVTALPFPSTVAAKANAVSTALDQLIEQANAAATPNRSEQRSDVQIRSPGSTPVAPSRVRPSSQ